MIMSGSPSAEAMPVLRLTGMRLMPSGGTNWVGRVSFNAACMNSLNTGAASPPPVAPRPSGAGLSKPR